MTSSNDADPVGSVGEEALRLLKALGGGDVGSSTGEATPHTCPHGWCPVCQVATFVRDNPEVVAQVSAAGLTLIASMRDLLDAALQQGKSHQDQPPQDRP